MSAQPRLNKFAPSEANLDELDELSNPAIHIVAQKASQQPPQQPPNPPFQVTGEKKLRTIGFLWVSIGLFILAGLTFVIIGFLVN